MDKDVGLCQYICDFIAFSFKPVDTQSNFSKEVYEKEVLINYEWLPNNKDVRQAFSGRGNHFCDNG